MRSNRQSSTDPGRRRADRAECRMKGLKKTDEGFVLCRPRCSLPHASGSLFDHKPVHRPQNYVSRLPWTRQTTPIRRLLRSCVPNTPMLRKRPSQITSANATKRRVGVEAGISQSPDTRSMVQIVSRAHTILWVLVKVLALDPTRNQSSPISCQQLFLRRGSPRQRN